MFKSCALILAMVMLVFPSFVLAADEPVAVTENELLLFAVEIQVGPNWDHTRPAQEQSFFGEHSANLKQLRDSGALVMGARYSDKGLVILQARDEAGARAMMDADAAIQAGVFSYQIYPFNVFYSGTLNRGNR